MITKYKLRLTKESEGPFKSEWAYYLYAVLLSNCENGFTASLHEQGITPISQYLVPLDEHTAEWRVSLLGDAAEESMSSVVAEFKGGVIKNPHTEVKVNSIEKEYISNFDDFLSNALECGVGSRNTFRIVTPAAFKSNGKYHIIPSAELIVKNLIQKWNGCFPNTQIEDENGAGIRAITEGIEICGFSRLNSTGFYLKQNRINSFTGNITIRSKLNGFHGEFWKFLAFFAGYSGIGIKTALGMGGTENIFIRSNDDLHVKK